MSIPSSIINFECISYIIGCIILLVLSIFIIIKLCKEKLKSMKMFLIFWLIICIVGCVLSIGMIYLWLTDPSTAALLSILNN